MYMINTLLQLTGYIQKMRVSVFAFTLLLSMNTVNASGSWVIETADDSGNVGGYTSIVLDSNNKVHISYYDAVNGNLKYATNSTGSWVAETVDNSGNVEGYTTSIALDSNNKVHISYYSYYDGINGDLKYATGTAGAWVTETIDHTDGGDVGWYSSIAVDSNNKVHISYYDFVNGALKYAMGTAGAWNIQTVDQAIGEDVGWDTSIEIDSNDDVHISYYDAGNFALKYATTATGAWVSETVDGSGSVGGFTSIAIDSNDKIHISYYNYYDGTNGDLEYATGTAGAWVTETIDHTDGEDVGWYSSIALDSNNRIHISYYDLINSNLKYATDASGLWTINVIDNSGDVVGDTSIDISNEVHISYYDVDSSNSVLKYAHADTVTPVILSTNPTNNASEVALDTVITATFSEDMDPATINTGTFTLSGGVTGTVTYDSPTKTATFTPSGNLAYNAAYTATITTEVKDLAGNPISSSYSFNFSALVDTTPPTVTINPVTTPTTIDSQTITGTVEAGASVYVTIDTAASDGAAMVTDTNWSYTITGLIEGINNITVTATDAAGNSATITSGITLDTVAPDTSITAQPSNPSNSTSSSFNFTSSEAGTFECRLDSSGYTSCTSPKSYTGLAQGSHTFYVRAIDGAGNTDASPASYSWVISTTPPALTIDTVVTPTNVNSQTITGTVEAGASVYVTTDTAASDGAATVTDTNWSYTITGLIEGINNITVTATDTAGSITTMTSSITLDSTPPEPQGTSPAVTLDGLVIVPGQTNPSYSYSNFTASWPSYSDSAGIEEYEIAVGDSASGINVKDWISVGTETSASTGDIHSLFETYKNANGEYFGKTFYLSVKAIDASGNESTVLSVAFVYTPAEINSKADGRDGTVDGFDLGMLGIAYDPFGSVPSGYEAADINRDGKVDNDDLFILAVNFGKVRQ